MTQKNSYFKIISTIVIIGVFLVATTFAADTTTTENIWKMLNCTTEFLSWSRVIFAVLAGKMMSNDMVYGSAINLDIYLRQIWNIIKNLANYTIGFLFIFQILKHLFDQKATIQDMIQKKVVSFLVAGILIQASWFLLWALVDVSTIATSAVGSIPWAIIQEDNWRLTKTINTAMLKLQWKTYKFVADEANKCDFVQSSSTTTPVPSSTSNSSSNTNNNSKFIDSILPNEETISWPLLFLWASIFEFFDYSNVWSKNCTDKTFACFISAVLDFITIWVYALMLMILFIINFVRVFYMWVFISFSPFIILLTVLQKVWWFTLWEKVKLPEWLEFKNVIHIIFLPVIYTVFLSVILMVVILSNSILVGTGSEFSMNGVSITNSATKSQINTGTLDFVLEWLKNWFSGLIIFGLTIYLFWLLIKTSLEWLPILKKLSTWITELIKQTARTIPIFPSGDGKWTSWSAIKNTKMELENKFERETWFDIDTWDFGVKWRTALQNKISWLFGLDGGRTDEDGKKMEMERKTFDSTTTLTQDNTESIVNKLSGIIKDKYPKWLDLNSTQWDQTVDWIYKILDKWITIPSGTGTGTITAKLTPPSTEPTTIEGKREALNAFLAYNTDNYSWKARKYLVDKLWLKETNGNFTKLRTY